MKHSVANTTCIGIRACGLPKNVSRDTIDLIVKWVKSSGEEWTVSRLKELKTAYVRRLAGTPYQPEWFAFHSNGLPKGPWKAVFKCKKPHKVLSALMVYTGFKAKTVTMKQFRKFDGSAYMADYPAGWNVEYKPAFEQSDLESLTGFTRCSATTVRHRNYDRFVSLSSFLLKQIRVPSFTGKGSSYKTEPLSMQALVNSMSHPFFTHWISQRKDVPSEYLEAFWSSPLLGNPVLRFGHFVPVGRVSFLQEPGYKLRAVFNPLPCFQLALSDMGSKLFNYLKSVPEDCTFDQDRGAKDVAEALRSGIKLSTLDLSDATNSFPLDVTMFILEQMNDRLCLHTADLQLFEALSRAPWKYPKNPEGKDLCFLNRGQPLGLYPSFAAFALSHHCIVRACNPSFYRILGDDIVIDSESAVRLRHSYERLGVKLSEQKCFDSDRLAEFAGKVIIDDKFYVQPKHRQLSDRNFVDVLRKLPGFKKFTSARQRKVVKILDKVHAKDSPFGLAQRYIDIPERPLIASYLYSQMISEILEGDQVEDKVYSSPYYEKLKRLSVRIQLRRIRELHENVLSGFDVEVFEEETICEDRNSVEARVLERSGVNLVESDHAIHGWVLDNRIPSGDPRPESKAWLLSKSKTLRFIEKCESEILDEHVNGTEISETCDMNGTARISHDLDGLAGKDPEAESRDENIMLEETDTTTSDRGHQSHVKVRRKR